MEAKKLENVSLQAYVQLEKDNDTKYEYHAGAIYAMAGGSLNHGLICGNVFGELRAALREKNEHCKVLNSEIKLHVASKERFLYPDAMVICGEIERSSANIDAVTNPIVIVEVLSKTTASYDRGDKFYFYRQIESLQAYLLVEQEKALIESYTRAADLWKIARTEGLEERLFIPSLNLSLSLEEVYRDVVFDS